MSSGSIHAFAAELAGLNAVRLITNLTAAAMAYGLHNAAKQPFAGSIWGRNLGCDRSGIRHADYRSSRLRWR